METTCSSEALALIYKSTWRHIPEECHQNGNWRGRLNTYATAYVKWKRFNVSLSSVVWRCTSSQAGQFDTAACVYITLFLSSVRRALAPNRCPDQTVPLLHTRFRIDRSQRAWPVTIIEARINTCKAEVAPLSTHPVYYEQIWISLTLEGPCIIFCNMYTFQRDTQCCSTDCLLMHRCQLYMFRTVTVHPQKLLFRCCMCRLSYVVRTALSDTSRWYNGWGRTVLPQTL